MHIAHLQVNGKKEKFKKSTLKHCHNFIVILHFPLQVYDFEQKIL